MEAHLRAGRIEPVDGDIGLKLSSGFPPSSTSCQRAKLPEYSGLWYAEECRKFGWPMDVDFRPHRAGVNRQSGPAAWRAGGRPA